VALLAALVLAPAAEAAFPGANGKIAFDAFDGNDGEIYTINPDGSGLIALTSTDNDDEFEPAWSADGTRIVYVRQIGITAYELWTMNADGSGQAPIPGGSGFSLASPAFTADGSRIVFNKLDSDFRIWSIPVGGGTQQQLSTGPAVGDFEPTTSPVADVIAFSGDDIQTSSAIFAMGGGGGAGSALTPTDGSIRAEGPNYSPDATLLTFSRCSVGEEGCQASPMEIVRMSAGGGPIAEVTSLPGTSGDEQHLNPVFSPDGNLIAFAREQAFSPAGIFTVVPSGGNAPLALTPASLPSAENPDWQPVARSERCHGEAATIVGNGEDNKIVGTPKDDVIKGRKGKDRIKGKGGDDIICGQRGNDRLLGGKGDDVLIGGKGKDFLKGGGGKDVLFGGTPGAPDFVRAADICVAGKADKTSNCIVAD